MAETMIKAPIYAKGCTMIENKSRSMRFFESFANLVLRFRWMAIFVVILLTGFFLMKMQGLKFDGSVEVWFVKDDPAMERLNKFKNTFSNDHFVYILIDMGDFFQPEAIQCIGRLAAELEEKVPYLKNMTWLGNAEYIESTQEGVEVVKLFEEIPDDPDEIVRRKNKALSEPDFVDRFISKDGKTTAILLEMDRYPDDKMAPQEEIPPVVYEILNKPDYNGLKVHVVGEPIFEYNHNKIAVKETPFFFGLCILIQMGLLAWLGRGVRGVVVPLVVVILSVLWTFGIIGVLGFDLNTMIIGLPVLLICVGIGDAMHIITEFNDHRDHGCSRREAIINSITMAGMPCLLTSLTTAAAFFSFVSVSITPFRQMGMYLPFGVITALLLSLLLVPFFYSFGKKTLKKGADFTKPRNDLFDRFLGLIYRIDVTYPKTIVVLFAVLFTLAVIGCFNVEVESNMAKLLTNKVPIRRAMDYVDSKMGGSMGLEIMLDTGVSDGVKHIDFIKKMDEMETFVDEHPLTTNTASILDVMKKMRRALHGNNEAYYALPDSTKAVSQYLFMYEMSGGYQLDKLVSFDYDIARLNVKTRSLDTRDTRQLMADVKEFAAMTFGGSVRVDPTGSMDAIKSLNDRMASGQKISFCVAFGVILLIMTLVLRSFKLGLISMIPNIFPVFMVLGFLGYAGMYMAMVLMSVSAMIIGVAVDDSIHFFVRYRREFKRLGRYNEALKATLVTVGRPICFTTITLTLGFSVLMLSNMTGWIRIGALSGFAFTWALLADLFLAPSILLLIKPLGPERKENYRIATNK
jgi:predicted RND superfamily exporter protein